MPQLPTVTHADYARAEAFLPWNAARLIHNAEVRPSWLSDGVRCWYRRTGRDGTTFLLLNTDTGATQPAFDHVRLAAALSRAAGQHYVHTQLPFERIAFTTDERALRFDIGDQTWTCNLTTYDCAVAPREVQPKTELRSPDGKWAAFVRNHNLWLRDLATNSERPLTTDGGEYNAYAVKAGSSLAAVTDKVIGRPATPVALWSPDSTKLVTYRLDERPVRDLHLQQAVPTDGSARPVLHLYRTPLVGDEHLPLGHLVMADVVAGTVTPLQVPPIARFSSSPFEGRQVWFSADSARLYTLSPARGGRSVTLHLVDPATGVARLLIEEHGPTFVYPHHVPQVNTNVHEVSAGNACTWFSQRDGWGHLYLYDTATGTQPTQLTSGAWTVRDIIRVDDATGWLYLTAGGREAGRDPYYRHLYRVRLDGSDLTLLTPEDADHTVTFAPSGAHFLDTYSRVDLPPVTVLRTADGTLVATLETADITGLTELGWQPPERFVVKARDGVTDLYGTITRPTTYDPAQAYPVLDSIYPGPQIIRAPKVFAGGEQGGRNFWQDQSLAELGFLVVTIDGLGTPYRSKAFVDVAYGAHFGEAGGLTDHIIGLRQLATRNTAFDLDRVGIFGHSGGGFASARAMLLFPDFFKVAVASAGNHDQRGYLATWGEFYVGLPEGADQANYAAHDNTTLATNLRGKLLLVHGELDDNVHPGLTLRLADALIAANKDFDLLIIPFTNHGLFDLRLGLDAADRHISLSHPYFIRRRWDYFVTHLLGATPPAGYAIEQP